MQKLGIRTAMHNEILLHRTMIFPIGVTRLVKNPAREVSIPIIEKSRTERQNRRYQGTHCNLAIMRYIGRANVACGGFDDRWFDLFFLITLPGSTVGRVRADYFYVRSGFIAKEELLTMEGFIDEVLPDGRFGVMLDNQHRIIAYTAGKMRKFRIRSVAGDRVHVEMTPYDLSKGRIVFREKTPGQGMGARPRSGFRR